MKFWLGLSPRGIAERLGWTASCGLGVFRMLLLILISSVKVSFWLALGMAVNIVLSISFAWLFSLKTGAGTLPHNFALAMMTALFLSLVSMIRAGGPDIVTIVFGAIPRRPTISFVQLMTDEVEAVTKSALEMEDNYRAVARYWYAKPFVFAELISYILVCITLFSAFMTCAVAYFGGMDLVRFAKLHDAGRIFLYYFQMGFDGSFFNTLDLAGIELSNARPIESFALRLIRFGIYTLYLGRIVGYISDVLSVRTDTTRETLIKRVGLAGSEERVERAHYKR